MSAPFARAVAARRVGGRRGVARRDGYAGSARLLAAAPPAGGSRRTPRGSRSGRYRMAGRRSPVSRTADSCRADRSARAPSRLPTQHWTAPVRGRHKGSAEPPGTGSRQPRARGLSGIGTRAFACLAPARSIANDPTADGVGVSCNATAPRVSPSMTAPVVNDGQTPAASFATSWIFIHCLPAGRSDAEGGRSSGSKKAIPTHQGARPSAAVSSDPGLLLTSNAGLILESAPGWRPFCTLSRLGLLAAYDSLGTSTLLRFLCLRDGGRG